MLFCSMSSNCLTFYSFRKTWMLTTCMNWQHDHAVNVFFCVWSMWHNLTDRNNSNALGLNEVAGIRIRFCNLRNWNTAFANPKLFDPLHEIWLMHVTFWCGLQLIQFFLRGTNQHVLLSAHLCRLIVSTWTFLSSVQLNKFCPSVGNYDLSFVRRRAESWLEHWLS
jgi:hypothetical protein